MYDAVSDLISCDGRKQTLTSPSDNVLCLQNSVCSIPIRNIMLSDDNVKVCLLYDSVYY